MNTSDNQTQKLCSVCESFVDASCTCCPICGASFKKTGFQPRRNIVNTIYGPPPVPISPNSKSAMITPPRPPKPDTKKKSGGFFSLFKKKTPLTTNFNLTEYFDPYYHSGDYYLASQHSVQKRVLIPDGPQGYVSISIPPSITTKEALYRYLIKYHHYKKK